MKKKECCPGWLCDIGAVAVTLICMGLMALVIYAGTVCIDGFVAVRDSVFYARQAYAFRQCVNNRRMSDSLEYPLSEQIRYCATVQAPEYEE